MSKLLFWTNSELGNSAISFEAHKLFRINSDKAYVCRRLLTRNLLFKLYFTWSYCETSRRIFSSLETFRVTGLVPLAALPPFPFFLWSGSLQCLLGQHLTPNSARCFEQIDSEITDWLTKTREGEIRLCLTKVATLLCLQTHPGNSDTAWCFACNL